MPRGDEGTTAAPPDTDLPAAWARLEATKKHGQHLIRLHPRRELSATIRNPDRLLGLVLVVGEELTFEPSELAGSQQVGLTVSVDAGTTTIALDLRHQQFREMFLQLCDDLVPRVLREEEEAAGAGVLVRRFNAWQRFLKRAGQGMSPERQRGLYGELKTLGDLMLPVLGGAAVDAWTGPSRAPQDFQASGIALEVKTIVHSEPQHLKIDGERQLDDFGLAALLLVHHRILKHRDAGETLNDVIDGLRHLIAESGGGRDQFDDRLLEYGYADHERNLYSGVGYSLRETMYYRVRAGFPRLTEIDLVAGLGGLSYEIDASACIPFAIDREAVEAWLREPPRVKASDAPPESLQVEYKQTAWTPTETPQNPQHGQALVARLKTGVVKTVVAFLNSTGGELVIGVADRSGTITGIGVDLGTRTPEAADLDLYERKLMDLLASQIDARVSSQVRLRFETHREGITCHVSVRSSPTPRFGRPVPEPGEQARAVFWVRRGNATVALEGEEMLAYITEHWA